MDNVDSNPINKTNINDDITLPNFINKCNNPKKKHGNTNENKILLEVELLGVKFNWIITSQMLKIKDL